MHPYFTERLAAEHRAGLLKAANRSRPVPSLSSRPCISPEGHDRLAPHLDGRGATSADVGFVMAGGGDG
jgi:hypothetical protein